MTNSTSQTQISLERDNHCTIYGDKHQEIPYCVKWICSTCGHENIADYTDGWYIGDDQDMNNGIYEQKYSCENEWQDETGQWKGCDNKITIKLKINITAELVSD